MLLFALASVVLLILSLHPASAMASAASDACMAKLTLSHLRGTYSVVRLEPNTKPPDWLWESQFYSLTKTEDELSIVCNQSSVPPDVVKDEARCETGWALFKVEGPLDFGLTGILNKLTAPLAKAGISIFAISTYDTDYILVKERFAYDVGYAWVIEGHVVNGLPAQTTSDGAVTVFDKDPMIKRMIDLTRGVDSAVETFGIVMVAGWVPSEATQSAYTKKFLPAVKKCFQESDWSPSSADGIPNVYLYPSRYLHVTVATLHAFWRPLDSESKKKTLAKEWTDLAKAASEREEWPKAPLQLALDSAQIGKKAGILLWKELSGGMDQMRICIKAEAANRERRLIQAGIDPGTLHIPGIIHSTFLRFHELPETPGKVIQESFEKHVKEPIDSFFPEPITAPQAKVVYERLPYMHIEDDERHVFATFPLAGSAK